MRGVGEEMGEYRCVRIMIMRDVNNNEGGMIVCMVFEVFL